MLGLYNWFCMNVMAEKDAIALVTDSEHISYNQLSAGINRLAYGMREAGIGKGTRVGMLFYNSRDFVECYYACLKLGAFFAPFNYRCSTHEVSDMISSFGCSYYIYGDDFTGLIDELRPAHPDMRWIGCGEDVTLSSLRDNDRGSWDYYAEMEADDDVLCIFTGGTTGSAKAAVHSHQGVAMQVLTRIIDYSRQDVYLNSSPMFHIGGMSTMQIMLTIGSKLVIRNGFDAEDIMRTIQDEKVTMLFLIPPNICDRFFASPEWGKYDLSSVNTVRVGGSANSLKILEKVFRAFPNASALNSYNNSEFMCPLHMFYTPELLKEKPELCKATGIPHYSAQVKLLDDGGNEVPIGQVGELWAHCWGSMSRYLNGEAPKRGKYFATGDLFTQDEEGRLYFVDRKKDMIKSGGENVYAVEVETVINAMDGVSKCAVIGLPDEKWGEMVAAVVIKSDPALTERDVQDYCAEHIAHYKKPKKVIFVDELPLTSIGKISKRALRQLFSQTN